MLPYPRLLGVFTTTLLLSLTIPLPIETLLETNAAIAQTPPASPQRTTTPPAQQTEANRLLQQGIQQFNRSQYQEALQSWQQSLELYREMGDRNGEARSLTGLGNAYLNLGQYPNAIESYQQSLSIVQAIGDRNGEAGSLMGLGIAYRSLGQYPNAIEYFQQSLSIFQAIGDRNGEARLLNNLGLAYSNLGQYSNAIECYQQSLSIFQAIGDRNGEARSLNNLGSAYDSLGQYPNAIESYQQSLPIFQAIGDRNGEAGSLNNLGSAYFNLGQYPNAIEYFQQSLAIKQAIGDRNGEARSLNNLGNAYLYLGQYPNAIEYYQQSLPIFQAVGDRNGEAGALNNLGNAYRNLGQYPNAIEYYQQSLSIKQAIGDRNGEARSLNNLGEAYRNLGQYPNAIEYYQQSLSIQQAIGDRNGEAGSLNNLGIAYRNLGQYPNAIEYFQQSLDIKQAIGDRNGEARSLNNLGEAYRNLGQYPKAIEYYEQSLAIFQAIGDREGEGLLLSNIGTLLSDQNQPEAAIVFLKQSVNVRETIRQDNRRLSQELQQSYTDTVADTYRQLSELLLAQGRILEAQQVLELLKLQELREFTGVRARVTTTGIELTAAEQAIITQHDTLIAFGQQVNQCQRSQCSQLNTLLDQRDHLTQQFNQTLQTFEAEIRARLAQDRGALDTQDFSRAAREIVEAQPGTVMIYALVLDDKLWLLWATAGGVVNSVEVPVTRQQLGETVLQFRQLLSTPDADITQVEATAQQLYGWLIAPIAPELQKNQIQHLVFSLDRVTRYIPMAALFDGQHYLIENYTVSTVLSADLTRVGDRLPPGTDQTSVLAVGLSNPVPPDFPALPSVPAELNAIVRSADNPQGIYSGLQFLNQQFDDRTLRNHLPGHQIVHIATHGVFVPGRQDQSYLVLGNGQRMSISSIQDLQDLGGVRLVVLSACQTALGEPDQDGLEIAGIAYYFLNGGANTVLASLWAVNDASTEQLMQHFYRNLSQSTAQVPTTRAEALQQAQLSLLQGESRNRSANDSRAPVRVVPRLGTLPTASPGFSHPYYWAPFILIGNSL